MKISYRDREKSWQVLIFTLCTYSSQWFSVRGDFASQGTPGDVWRHFCSLHPCGGGVLGSARWRCCWTVHNAQNTVSTRNHPAPNTHCARVENPALTKSVASPGYIREEMWVFKSFLLIDGLLVLPLPDTKPSRGQNAPQNLNFCHNLLQTKICQVFPCEDCWENTCVCCLISFLLVCFHFFAFET